MFLSVLLSSLIAQSAADQLASAIREVRLEDAKEAIGLVAAGDASRAARTLSGCILRGRDRIGYLHNAVLAARRDLDRAETQIALTPEDERQKRLLVEAAAKALKEANRRAIDGELIYEALREGLGKLPRESAPALLEEFDGTMSWLLRCEIADAMGRMKAEPQLLKIVEREKEPVVLAAALEGVAAPRAADLVEHPAWQVRLAAVRSLSGLRSGVPALLKALEAGDARLRLAAGESLVALTKTSLPADAVLWNDWWKANRADWEADRYSPTAPKRSPGPGRTTFYEVPVETSRVCFVIDRSTSMKEGGRLDAAKAELKRLLKELPDGSRVNLLFFGETISSFSTSTRVLDAATRRAAEYFIDRQGYEEATNFFGAMEKAFGLLGSADSGKLREEAPDTIIVLSDGQPTWGRLVDEELCARVLARRVRWMRAVVHTVSLGARSKVLPLLAELTGGEHREK